MLITSKFAGRCTACRGPIAVGEQVDWTRGVGSKCRGCFSPAAAAPAAPRGSRVTACGPAWVFAGPFETKDVPKRARWFWHGKTCGERFPCKACPLGIARNLWWTDSAERLGDLVRHYESAEGAVPPLSFGDAETELRARSGALAGTEALAASRATDADVEIPVPDGLAYLPFQKAGIAFAASRPATLVGDEMGLGKTIAAIGVINIDASVRKVLVLCPASLKANWRRELQRWLVRPMTIALSGPKGDLDLGADVLIVNYDALIGRSGKALHARLMAMMFDCLVADECHFLKNPEAQRTVAVLGKAAKKGGEAVPGLASRAANRKLFLTGTPILNKPIEILPLLQVLSPTEFGNFWAFVKRYCAAQQKQVGRSGKMVWDFSGAANLDELQERLRRSVLVRRLKSEVLRELPPKRRQIVTLTVEDDEVKKLIAAERAAYDGAADEDEEVVLALGDDYRAAVAKLSAVAHETAEDRAALAEELEAYGDEFLPRRSRGSSEKAGIDFTALSSIRHQIALSKVPAVIEHVRGMIENDGIGKILVFAHHLDVVAALREGLADHGVVTITGETPVGERQDIVDRFQTDPSVKVFVGNIKAAGVGLTLTAACHVVFAELDWVPANVSQAEDRAHRIGQMNHVLVQHLVLDESLDAQFAKVLVAKQDIADAALDDARAAIKVNLPALPKRQPKLPEGVSVNDRGERTYPAPSDEERALAHRAVQIIAGMCDGAHLKDDAGFNATDTDFGHFLAGCDHLTDGQAWAARRLARKYRRQLPEPLVLALGVEAKPEAKKPRAAKEVQS